ncbi:MAG: PQ-loop domain-containing transporter [Dehalococcoidia bacterium]|nr:PQ-loop domain-containing transporter [Dehalococcoidia bacterium]
MELFGWIGFVLFQVFYIPQVVKVIRSQDATGLSLPSWLILWVALLLYLVYSIYRRDPVFTVGNAAGLVQASVMLFLIQRYGRRRQG